MNQEEVAHLVKLLTYVAQRNEGEAGPKTAFHQSRPEALFNLMMRLNEHIRCSPSCYAVALVYVDRVTEISQDLPLSLETVHHLFTTSLLLANQFLDDKAERALQFARVARIHPVMMANLKTDFLFRIRFRLALTDSEMRGYSDKLHGKFSTANFSELGMWDGRQLLTAQPVCIPATPTRTPPQLPPRRSSIPKSNQPELQIPEVYKNTIPSVSLASHKGKTARRRLSGVNPAKSMTWISSEVSSLLHHA